MSTTNQSIFELLNSISNRLDIIEKNTLKKDEKVIQKDEKVIQKEQSRPNLENLRKSDHLKIAKGMSSWIHSKSGYGKTTLALDLLKTSYLQYEEIYCTQNLLSVESYVSMTKVKNVKQSDVVTVLKALIQKQKQFLEDNPEKKQNENILFVIDDLEIDFFVDFMRLLESAKTYRVDLIVTSRLDLADHQHQFFDCIFNPMELMLFEDSNQYYFHQHRNICHFGGKTSLKCPIVFHLWLQEYATQDHEWMCIFNKKYNENVYYYVPKKMSNE